MLNVLLFGILALGGAMHVSETALPCGEGEAESGDGKESSRTPLSQDSQVGQF